MICPQCDGEGFTDINGERLEHNFNILNCEIIQCSMCCGFGIVYCCDKENPNDHTQS
jgi:hypothetical protein